MLCVIAAMSVLGLPKVAGDILGQQVQVKLATRTEPDTFSGIPKRWIIERSFVWLEKTIDCGKNRGTGAIQVHSALVWRFVS